MLCHAGELHPAVTIFDEAGDKARAHAPTSPALPCPEGHALAAATHRPLLQVRARVEQDEETLVSCLPGSFRTRALLRLPPATAEHLLHTTGTSWCPMRIILHNFAYGRYLVVPKGCYAHFKPEFSGDSTWYDEWTIQADVRWCLS